MPVSIPDRRTPRNVYVFGATSFLNDTATEMAYWILPAFIASLGAGPAKLGIIEGVAESVASFAKLFSGYLSDHVARRKPIVVGGYFVANAVKPLLALVSSWGQILGIRFADRFAKGVRGTARDVMVADSVDKASIGSAYGLIQAMDSAGAIAGPLLALALIGHFGMRGDSRGRRFRAHFAFWWHGWEFEKYGKTVPSCQIPVLSLRSQRLGERRVILGFDCHLGFTTFSRLSLYFLWAIRVTCFLFCGRATWEFPSPNRRCWDSSSTSHLLLPLGQLENSATASLVRRLRQPVMSCLPSSTLCLRWRLRGRRSGWPWLSMDCSMR